jgi:signal transduction histidine kinase
MAQRLGPVEGGRRQMLADLAHEIRTPVAVMEAYLEALEDGVKSFDAEAIGVLRDQSRRLTRFSTDVTALSDAEHRAETIEARLIDIRGIVTTTAAALEPRYRAKGVNLETAVPTRSTVVYADSERVGQVLTNLLDNALRHTPTGGSVSITARWGDDDATVVVSDTGDGIPPEHLNRLFDRFYRVDAARDRAHGGAGIGLAIAKALIEAHGGSIQADSRGPGTGSAFSFSLPRDLLRAGGRPAGASAPGG